MRRGGHSSSRQPSQKGPSVNLEEDGAHSPLHSGQTDVLFAHALSRRHPPARRPGQVCARSETRTHLLLSGGGGGASPSPRGYAELLRMRRFQPITGRRDFEPKLGG
ncbi:hypothetical protein MDA_GLEAN10014520 [Myotis davidii]|uniref:Uncharacterized protein n=1 Tax=Myotis davidii TaxID=225400 RepID=L5M1G3_MYODS|nr:hypothetical protein MDA_GLEAN10014520 [Myotis davidii]